jgi:hypothetical protein
MTSASFHVTGALVGIIDVNCRIRDRKKQGEGVARSVPNTEQHLAAEDANVSDFLQSQPTIS